MCVLCCVCVVLRMCVYACVRMRLSVCCVSVFTGFVLCVMCVQ